MATVQMTMLAGLPFTALRDAVIAQRSGKLIEAGANLREPRSK